MTYQPQRKNTEPAAPAVEVPYVGDSDQDSSGCNSLRVCEADIAAVATECQMDRDESIAWAVDTDSDDKNNIVVGRKRRFVCLPWSTKMRKRSNSIS